MNTQIQPYLILYFLIAGIDIPVLIKTRYFFFRSPGKSKDFLRTTAICENGANGSLEYSLIGRIKTDFKELMKLPDFVNREDFPMRDRSGRGISFQILEASSGDFRFKAIEQEYEEVELSG